MSNSISKARERLDKIKYYHKYAGANGYHQAMDYYSELVRICKKANQNDAPIIHIFYKEADELMEEMKKRQDDFKKESQ
ncbi:MAG: hypothetical protein NTW12_04705 [Deltaproteobacteria bacterium]|nr:hypothetical protein [Deltaproteobacteria bacterium]